MILYTDRHRIAFQIDDEDYEAVSRYSWSVGGPGYLVTNIGKWPTQRLLLLHQFLLGRAPAGKEWDHRNRDKLDNRRANLRLVTSSQNKINTGLRCDNASGHKGIVWVPRRRCVGKWKVQIGTPNQHIGYFDSLEEAIAARRAAEKSLWG